MRTQGSSFFYMSVVSLAALPSFADDIQDYWAFVDQFETINRLQVDCEYTRSMTLQPAEDVFINAVARGPYQYIYTEDGFRVETDIVSTGGQGAMLEQRGIYSYDGVQFRIFSTELDTSEDRTTEPFAGADFPLNPLLYPVSMLRNDLDAAQLLDIRHFSSRGVIEQNIESMKIVQDSDTDSYISVRLLPERNREFTEEIDSHYRVYMGTYDGLSAGRSLPKRLEMIQGKDIIAIIEVESYTRVSVDKKDVYLPETCGFVLIEGDEATIEFRVDDAVYSDPSTDADLYVLDQAASHHIDTDGTLSSAGGTISLPKGAQEHSSTSLLQEDTDEKQAWSLSKIFGVLIVILAITLGSVVLFRSRQA